MKAVLLAVAILPLAPSAALAGPSFSTGTSSIAEPPLPGLAHTVENRLFSKSERFVARAGFSWLARDDLRTNPGVSLDLGWYPSEVLGLELVSLTGFFSELSGTADALRRSTGLLPDSEKPLLRATGGARLSFAYGKLLIEEADTVLHLDASFAAHAGALITERDSETGGGVGANFAADLDLALQVAIGARALVFAQGGWMLGYERRTTTSFASGLLLTFGLGVLL
jgi:hypothetical protein